MTPAQESAFTQIEQILREHFEAGAFVVLADLDDHREEVRAGWHGGKTRAVGLFLYGADRVRGILNQGEYTEE